MKKEFIFSEISNLKGVGPQLTKYLKRKRIEKIKDIVLNLPYSETDRSKIVKLNELRRDKITLDHHIGKFNFKRPYPFDALYKWAEETLGEEAQELLVSIILEPFGNLIDNLSSEMSDNNQFRNKINGSMLIGDFLKKTEQHYDFALKINWNNSENNQLAWYISEEKLEPRLGDRYKENGIGSYEQPLQPGRDVAKMLSLIHI